MPFTWSGRNSHQARARAAQELAEHLEKVARENEGARQWIVAHSHGGNVALHALELFRNSGRRTRVSVVTLATPFIHARAWTRTSFFAFHIIWSGVLLFTAATWTAATGNDSYVARGMELFGIIFAIEVLWCIVGAVNFRHYLGRGFGKRLVASIQVPEIPSRDLTVIRAPGDEASFSLASGQFVGWLGSLIARPLGNRKVWWHTLMIVSLPGTLAISLGRYVHTGTIISGYLFVSVWLFCLGGVMVLLAGSLGFGLEDGPFVSIFASVSVEDTPPGRIAVQLLRHSTSSKKLGLSHSRLYDDPEAIEIISKAIRR
ncbi:hypothetical protein [Streptomyces cellostaticus]|nr:hypothetical protein [Streptomyces cellostaticus]